MSYKYKYKYTIILLFILLFIYLYTLLYLHGILPYLNIKIIIVLLKNKINIFKLEINDSLINNNSNSISSGNFLLLVEELL